MRLQRALAAAGIASRRHCEEIIREGRVDVDGKTVTELGTKVDPTRQKITVDGQAIRIRRHVYFMLNKPPGVLSTSHDESGRIRAIDLIESKERIYTVGRLDRSSEGLILITNDGDLANQLTHPRFGVEKTYLVRVVGRPTPEHFDRLKSGVHLAEGFARVAQVRARKQLENCTDLEIVLREGRNREIRRVLASVGHKVVSLKRIAIGPVRLGELPTGAYRELTRSEVDALQEAASAGKSSGRRVRRPLHGGSRKRSKFAPRAVGHFTPRPSRGPSQKPGEKPMRGSRRGRSRGPKRGRGATSQSRGSKPFRGRADRGRLPKR
jgi:23S rRNA pseudouridine2605 synthase